MYRSLRCMWIVQHDVTHCASRRGFYQRLPSKRTAWALLKIEDLALVLQEPEGSQPPIPISGKPRAVNFATTSWHRGCSDLRPLCQDDSASRVEVCIFAFSKIGEVRCWFLSGMFGQSSKSGPTECSAL